MIQGGSTTGDAGLVVKDHDGANSFFTILGNGDLCISRTASLTNGRMSMDFSSAADNGFCINDTASGNGAAFINFHTGGNSRGTITNNNNSAVAYNTSSDYRLKENVSYSFDATTELKKLKPAKFNFIGGDLTIEGFLAHEAATVVPQAVTGTKDETEVLENVVLLADGSVNTRDVTEAQWTTGKGDGIYPSDSTWTASKTVPVYQGIDQSKLVPLLVKTIQELEARIKALEDA